MASNNKKRVFAKFITRASSTTAMAVALTAALANPVHAEEIDQLDHPDRDHPKKRQAVEFAAGNNGFGAAEAAAASTLTVSPESNQTIEAENDAILTENEAAIEQNNSVVEENNAAAENNEAATGGALVDPGLTMPEAPETPDTDGMGDEQYNDAVNDYNESVDDYNAAADEYNQGVDDYNAAADAYDQQAQEQYEEDKAAYEEEKAAHEEAVEQYEEDLKEYEEDKAEYDQYLEDLEQYEEDLDQYEEDLKQYEEDQAQYESDTQAYKDYLAAKEAYDAAKAEYDEQYAQYEQDKAQWDTDSQAYQDYLAAKEAYDAAKAEYDIKYAAYLEEQKAYEDATDAYDQYLEDLEEYEEAQKVYEEELKQYEEDQAQYESDTQAYKDYLAAKEAYDAAKEAYDQEVEAYEKESGIYEEVVDYNADITTQNQDVAEKNEALEESVHASNVDNIDQLDGRNDDVKVDQSVLDVLNTYDDLAAAKSELETTAAALATDERKDADLDSEDYMAYLEAVEAYNAAVAKYNENAAAYNEAVATYNAAVEAYNESRTGDASADSSTDTGTADWGNISLEEKVEDDKKKDDNKKKEETEETTEVTFGHVDVKYTAAVAKEKTEVTDEDGNTTESYADLSAGYTVIGVYTSKEAAEAGSDTYGVNYKNDASSDYETQSLTKDSDNYEFKGHDTDLDPDEGQLYFYVALENNETKETEIIQVTLSDTDVYPEGTYYAGIDGKSLGQLANYLDSEGDPLKTVVIGDTTYYDISGQSVFVISALACDGARYSDGIITTDGLDLVLNVQTLIEIHKADNAQTLSYVSYEYGITAQAEAPAEPGDEPVAPEEVAEPGEAPVAPTAPTAPEEVAEPGEAPVEPTAPTKPTEVADPGEAPEEPIAPTAPEEVAEPGEAPVEPTAPTEPTEVADPGEAPEDPGEFDKTEPEAPVPTTRLNHVVKLNQLTEKTIVHLDFGDLIPEGGSGTSDKDVPVAEVPKTGDMSALWGTLSALSLGGMALLNRKREDEE